MLFAGISLGIFLWVGADSFGIGVVFAILFGVIGIKACVACLLLCSQSIEKYPKQKR